MEQQQQQQRGQAESATIAVHCSAICVIIVQADSRNSEGRRVLWKRPSTYHDDYPDFNWKVTGIVLMSSTINTTSDYRPVRRVPRDSGVRLTLLIIWHRRDGRSRAPTARLRRAILRRLLCQ